MGVPDKTRPATLPQTYFVYSNRENRTFPCSGSSRPNRCIAESNVDLQRSISPQSTSAQAHFSPPDTWLLAADPRSLCARQSARYKQLYPKEGFFLFQRTPKQSRLVPGKNVPVSKMSKLDLHTERWRSHGAPSSRQFSLPNGQYAGMKSSAVYLPCALRAECRVLLRR